MKRAIIISIVLTLLFATTGGAASRSSLNKKLEVMQQEFGKFFDILLPTFAALDEYCGLAATNSFSSYDDRMTKEDYIDDRLDKLREQDIYIQKISKKLAQSLYDSGYVSGADQIIEQANNGNDDRVEAINNILKKFSGCIDE